MESWVDTYGEPQLAELLDEPIVNALMTSDGVERGWLEQLIATKALERNAEAATEL